MRDRGGVNGGRTCCPRADAAVQTSHAWRFTSNMLWQCHLVVSCGYNTESHMNLTQALNVPTRIQIQVICGEKNVMWKKTDWNNKHGSYLLFRSLLHNLARVLKERGVRKWENQEEWPNGSITFHHTLQIQLKKLTNLRDQDVVICSWRKGSYVLVTKPNFRFNQMSVTLIRFIASL